MCVVCVCVVCVCVCGVCVCGACVVCVCACGVCVCGVCVCGALVRSKHFRFLFRYVVIFPGVKRPGHEVNHSLHLVPRLRISGGIPPFTLCLLASRGTGLSYLCGWSGVSVRELHIGNCLDNGIADSVHALHVRIRILRRLSSLSKELYRFNVLCTCI